MRSLRRLQLSSLLVTASLSVALACSGSASPGPALPSSETTAETDTDADTQRFEAGVIGLGDYPRYTVNASAAWSSDGHFVTSGPGVIGFGVWDVGKVPRDPCHWKGQLRDPGPTTKDLVDALRDQKYRHITDPVTVNLAGHTAVYLEWSVPSDWDVTGDGDFKGCDVDPGNGHNDFVSWIGNGFGERYQQVAGQIDRLWILNLKGQRLIVDATYSPDTTKAARQELSRVVESIRFVDISD